MTTFRDSTGREWTLHLTTDAAFRVLQTTGVNLLAADRNAVLGQLISDPLKVAEIVHAIVQPEAHQRGVSRDDFFRAIGGDELDACTRSLLETWTNFIPDPREREAMRVMLAEIRKIASQRVDRAINMLENGELAKVMGETDSPKMSGESSTSAPESSESIQAPTPSGS